MMIDIMRCPVCDTENNREYYTGPFGVEEDQYSCKNCGYFSYMCYGPYYRGIDTISGTRQDSMRKAQLLVTYADRIKELELEIDPEYAQYL